MVFVTARSLPITSAARRKSATQGVLTQLRSLADAGWSTNVAAMFGDVNEPTVYQTGFAHDVDLAVVWEAPDSVGALHSVDAMVEAGWSELFDSTWEIGRREFAPVPTRRGRQGATPWAMFALWEWNDAWQSATPAERLEYDAECDVAFRFDVESGVSIAGRHRLDHQSRWHHLGIWEAPTFDHVTRGIAMHERVGDFKFTTSRHYIGRSVSADDYFKEC